MEGRLAPSTILPGGAHAATHAAVHATRPAHSSSSTTTVSINWNRLGDQIRNFFGYGKHSKPHHAAPVRTLHP
jgi:hypothetical protein